MNLFIPTLPYEPTLSPIRVHSGLVSGYVNAHDKKRSHLNAGLELFGLRHPAQRAGVKRNAAATTTIVSTRHCIC